MRGHAIQAVPCLADNYAYLILHGGEAWVVDPSDGAAVARALRGHPGVRLRGVLATHHHADHVGGVETLLRLFADHSPRVAAHATDRGRVPSQDVFVEAPQDRFADTELTVGGVFLQAMHVPGHTGGGVAWRVGWGGREPAEVFTGDTLFAGGCGRLFEGTAEQMYRSLGALTGEPADSRLWFGHEYTEGNLRFAVTVEPDNAALSSRLDAIPDCTTPTTVADELATNPFVRAGSVAELALRRAAKDRF